MSAGSVDQPMRDGPGSADKSDGASASSRLVFRIAGRRVSFGRSGTLLISRVYEQGVLGVTSVVLAWRLGISGFAPVSALLVVNSLSITLSDFGLGTDLMRREIQSLSKRTINTVRLLNLVGLVVLLPVGLIIGGQAGMILAGGSLIWLVSAESRIRKNALVRLDRATRAAGVELIGSSALGFWVVVALLEPVHATGIVVLGLASKHILEALFSSGWSQVFGDRGGTTWSFNVWLSSLLGFAISNVDFLIIAWVISAEAFSIYSLGFRLSALFVSQISYVVNRVALVDFGEAYRSGTLAVEYARRRRQLFLVGIAAGVLTAGAAPLLVLFLGRQWAPVIGVAIVLSIATPWRMCTGLGITTAISVGESARLSRWEASRLVVAAAVLTLGGLAGLRGFTVAAAAVVIVTTVGYDQVSQRFAGIHRRSLLLMSMPVAAVLVAVAAAVLPFSR